VEQAYSQHQHQEVLEIKAETVQFLVKEAHAGLAEAAEALVQLEQTVQQILVAKVE
jgi:hypothetical protein